MPDPIVTLSRRFLRQPVTIHAGHTAETGPSPQTKQVVYRTHPLNKVEMVARILQAEGRGLTMIFTRTKRAADRVAEDLDFRGFAVAAVHGDLGQGARERALRAFRAGKIDVLVATDVAARGLDVTGVTHVINYDCPEDPDTYTHRIGRTGRAGATGVAVTFVDWEDMPRWRIIDKTLGPGHAGAAGDVPHLAAPLHRPGHLHRGHRHPAHRRAHPGRAVRRGRGGPGWRRPAPAGATAVVGAPDAARAVARVAASAVVGAMAAATAPTPARRPSPRHRGRGRRRRRRHPYPPPPASPPGRRGGRGRGDRGDLRRRRPRPSRPTASDGEASKPRRRRRRRGGGSGAGAPAEATAD